MLSSLLLYTIQALPAMMVTYRLAGVDGEATEEVVKSLADSDSAADQDPEEKFAIARDIAEVCCCCCCRCDLTSTSVARFVVSV